MLALSQAECPVFHHFGPGIYIREVHLPAGATAIGHAQKFAHTNVMIKGRVLMFNEDGTTKELVAPLLFVGKPGRKVGHVLEDTVWQNIYATDETDVETLERTYLDKSETWRADHAARAVTQNDRHAADRADYLAVLAESGFDHDMVRAQSENTSDQIAMPAGSYAVMVADSPVEGRGLFATAAIKAGGLIAPGRIGGKRTPAGRYTNHSAKPNAAVFLRDNGDMDLVALTDIAGCRGGQIGEEITIDYRQVLRLQGARLKGEV